MSQEDDFVAITGTDVSVATKYLKDAKNNLERAIQLYYDRAPTSVTTAKVVPVEQRAPAPVTEEQEMLAAASSAPVPEVAPRPVFEDASELSFISRKPIPFVGLNINAKLVGLAAEVTLDHLFVNSNAEPIEASYRFYQGECSVTALEIIVDGKTIRAVIKEKEAAQNKVLSVKPLFLLNSMTTLWQVAMALIY